MASLLSELERRQKQYADKFEEQSISLATEVTRKRELEKSLKEERKKGSSLRVRI
jgi:hypothetical protein